MRRGRGSRPLHRNKPIHLVFKCRRSHLPSGLRGQKAFQLCNEILKKYSEHFFVKIEQYTIQEDHIHLIIKAFHKASIHNFCRVIAGQIAQRLQKEGLAKVSLPGIKDEALPKWKRQHNFTRLWRHRPFTRMVTGHKPLLILKNYLQLNELEARGKIPYQKNRLRGFSEEELRALWDD